MKKALFLVAAVLAFGVGNAQIVNGRIGQGNINVSGMQWNDVYGIDFDNDGTLEFRLSDFEGVDGSQLNAYISYDWTEGGNNVMADAEIWDYVAVLTAGSVIDANGNFAGYGDAMFEDLGSVPERIFVGFRIQLSDGVHYGWAEATVEAVENSNDIRLNWTACAYNTTPGGAIAAGATGGSVGIAEAEGTGMRAYALGQQSLRVEAGNTSVAVYDLGGRRLYTVGQGRTMTLQMPEAGVYLLCPQERSGMSRKVLVW